MVKKIICYFRGHQWQVTQENIEACSRCGHTRYRPRPNYVRVSMQAGGDLKAGDMVVIRDGKAYKAEETPKPSVDEIKARALLHASTVAVKRVDGSIHFVDLPKVSK